MGAPAPSSDLAKFLVTHRKVPEIHPTFLVVKNGDYSADHPHFLYRWLQLAVESKMLLKMGTQV